jgi:hypothetical protein
MEEESRDEGTEREIDPKRLLTRGKDRVPERAEEPTTEEGKALIKSSKKE